MKAETPVDIDAYIATFPESTQAILQQVRQTIQQAAPDATEAISYGMPTFKLNGNLVHFAGYANHIGFYATPTGNEEFTQELSKYKIGKGSIQFPINEQMPLDLISRITKFRVEQNLEKDKGRKAKG